MPETEKIDITQELVGACENMIDITGGSKTWDGETHTALKKIEKALFRAKRMMERANRGSHETSHKKS